MIRLPLSLPLATHYNSLIRDTCPTFGKGDVIISLAQELNTLPICSESQLPNQVVLLLTSSNLERTLPFTYYYDI